MDTRDIGMGNSYRNRLYSSHDKSIFEKTQNPQIMEITKGNHTLGIRGTTKLLAEAYDVKKETGLTPRQLADQNKELREALKELHSAANIVFGLATVKRIINGSDGGAEIIGGALNKAGKALKTPKQ